MDRKTVDGGEQIVISDEDLEKLMKRATAEIRRAHTSLNAFHDAIEERWGFCYNGENLDPIIDSVDYGYRSLNFKDLIMTLDKKKEQLLHEADQGGGL